MASRSDELSTTERLRPRTCPSSSPDLAADDPLPTLVKQIKTGVRYAESTAALHRMFRLRIHFFFLRKGFTRDESDELTQEVFLRVFKAIDTFRGTSRAEFESWLVQIADHIFCNEVRRRNTEMRHGTEYSLDAKPKSEDGKTLVEELEDEEPNPEDVILLQQSLAVLRQAIEKLPEKMRRCCLLRYKHGLKYKEIADEMGISIETVKAHLHQAGQRLRDLLGGRSGPQKGAP